MEKRVISNLWVIFLLFITSYSGLAATLANRASEIKSEIPYTGTITVNSTTNETCVGQNDGGVSFTIGNLGNATSVIVLITDQGSSNSFNDNLSVTSGSATGTFSNLPPATYFFQILASNSTIGPSPSPTFTIAAGGATISLASTPPLCNGDANGSVTVSASGGIAPYEYSIGSGRFQSVNVFGSLSAGQHTLNVRDASGCVTSQTITLTEPDALSATLSGTDVTCNGGSTGSIAAAVTGGTAPYVFSVDGGTTFAATLPGLTANAYSVIVKDANDCTFTSSITLSEPAVIVASVQSFTDVTCNNASDGTVTLAITGGTGPYSVFASNTTNGGGFSGSLGAGNVITGMSAGVWNLTIRDVNNCTFGTTLTATLTNPTLFELDALIGNKQVCDGATASLTVNVTGGEGPYMYSSDGGVTFQSSPVFSNLVVGTTYEFTAKDNRGCTATPYFTTTTVQVTARPAIVATLSPQEVSCFGVSDGSISVTGVFGGAGSGYEYSLDGTNFQTSTNFTGQAAGNYTVTVKDLLNCTKTFTTTINEPVQVTVSPSVLTNVSCFGGNDGSVEITHINALTPVMYSINSGTPQSGNTFTGLTAGNYTAEVISGTNSCVTSTTFTITEPASFSATAVPTNATCNGEATGAFTVSVAGGQSPYQYAIDGVTFGSADTFSQLAAGNYTATVRDANSCTTTVAVSITEPSPISVTYLATPPTCTGDNDGKIQINLASGGTGPLMFRLQGTTTLGFNILNLSPGNYNVEMVDANGCVETTVVTVPVALIVTADVTIDANASGCGNSDGAFTMSNPKKGSSINLPSVEYSIDGINFQSSPSFTGLAAGVYNVTVKDVSSSNSGTGNCEGTVSVTITEPSGITATVTETQITCNGGTGALGVTNVTGGTAPYEYSIDGNTFSASPNFTSLNAGSYNITIRDASSCTTALTASITEPDVLAATVVTTDLSCNGATDGSVIVTVSGGTAPYRWADTPTFGANYQSISGVTGTFSALSGPRTGNSAFVIDANDCMILVPFTIYEPAPLVASITNITDVTCNGADDGTITITTTGGTAPYEVTNDGIQYFSLASDGVVTGIGPTTIANLTLRDANGCQIIMAGFTVSEPAPLSATVTSSSPTCYGVADGSITIVPVSTTSNSFEYSIDGVNFSAATIFSQLSAGAYTITMRETGVNCASTFSITVTAPDLLESNASIVDVTCNGLGDGKIIVSAQGGTTPYEYSIDGGTTFQTEDFTGLDIGSYTMTVRDANGCTTTKSLVIAQPAELDLVITGVNNASCNGEADGSATQTVTGGTAPYSYSLDGQNFTTAVDLTSLIAGSYTLSVMDANGCTTSSTFTIEEPAAIVPVISTNTDISCNGLTDGSFTVAATGGDGTFMYSLDGTNFSTTNAFNGLAAGSYTVTVKDGSNCTATIVQTVTAPDVLNLQFERGNISCNGASDGQIAGLATGGAVPYMYSIDGTNFQTTPFSGLTAGNYILTVKDANDCSANTTVTIEEPVVLTSAITSTTNVDCKGSATGAAVLAVTGGSTPYNFSLDGNNFNTSLDLTSLVAGAYTVTIRDTNNCESTVSFNITEPDALNGAVTVTSHVSCNAGTDGSISLLASGGTAPYEYSQDGNTFGTESNFTSLVAGSYSFVIRDASGCTTTVSETIVEPELLILSLQPTNISCNGAADGTITPTTTGGIAPYEYSLDGTNFQSGSFNGQVAGTYTLTVRDANGCTESASVTLTEPLVLSASSTVTNVTCFGESNGDINISAAGGTGTYEYSLDGTTFQAESDFSGLAANSYTITVKDASGCTIALVAEVIQPIELSLSASIIDDNTITISASGGTAPYEYALDNGDFQVGSSFSGLTNGDYTITVRDASGCTSTTSSSLVITGDDDPFESVSLSAYPNPASDYLVFSKLSAGDQIRMISLNGKPLGITEITEEQETYRKDISSIGQKVFLVIVINKEGLVKLNQKVIKKE